MWRLMRRVMFLPVPHGVMCYMIAGKIMLWTFKEGYMDYDFLYIWSSFAHIHFYEDVILLLFYIFLFYFFCCWGVRLKGQVVDFSRVKVGAGPLMGVAILMWLRTIVHVSSLDFTIVMANTEYLKMAGLDALNTDSGLAKFIQQSNKLVGLITCIIWAFALAKGVRIVVLVLLPVVLWHWLFEFAGHSRYAAMMPIAMGGVYAIMADKKNPFIIIPFFLVGGVTLFMMLSGRGSGFHGFESIPYAWDAMVNNPNPNANSNTLANIFEGIFVVSEVFVGEKYYDEWYKILSISPFPSFIDGFNEIRVGNEVRVHTFVPMGGIAEIIRFGPLYMAIYFGIQVLAIRYVFMILRLYPGAMAILLNMILLLSCYLQFTYSVRTVFRFYVLVLILGTILVVIKQLRLKKKQQRQVRKDQWRTRTNPAPLQMTRRYDYHYKPAE